LGKVREDAPVTSSIGISQSTVGNRGPKTHVIELVRARAQTDFEIGEALSVSDLSERHGEKLLPTREVPDFVVSVVADETTTELLRMDPVNYLSENCFSCRHPPRLA